MKYILDYEEFIQDKLLENYYKYATGTDDEEKEQQDKTLFKIRKIYKVLTILGAVGGMLQSVLTVYLYFYNKISKRPDIEGKKIAQWPENKYANEVFKKVDNWTKKFKKAAQKDPKFEKFVKEKIFADADLQDIINNIFYSTDKDLTLANTKKFSARTKVILAEIFKTLSDEEKAQFSTLINLDSIVFGNAMTTNEIKDILGINNTLEQSISGNLRDVLSNIERDPLIKADFTQLTSNWSKFNLKSFEENFSALLNQKRNIGSGFSENDDLHIKSIFKNIEKLSK